MKNRISEKDVLQLLTSLKNSDNSYPKDMIESRRSNFAKQAAAMAVLMEAGVSGANSTSAGQSASTASTASSGSSAAGIGGASMGKILETALVIAIIAEAGVAAYIYREKIAEFFNSIFNPQAEQVANPPNNSPDLNSNSQPGTEFSTETPVVTVSETPIPPGYTPAVQADDSDNGDSQVSSTPAPTNDDNGLHLGQTKQPTKQPNKNKDKNKEK